MPYATKWPWTIKPIFQESLWQRLEVEVTKKRQEERLVKLVSDMRLMRREMLGLKHDLR